MAHDEKQTNNAGTKGDEEDGARRCNWAAEAEEVGRSRTTVEDHTVQLFYVVLRKRQVTSASNVDERRAVKNICIGTAVEHVDSVSDFVNRVRRMKYSIAVKI